MTRDTRSAFCYDQGRESREQSRDRHECTTPELKSNDLSFSNFASFLRNTRRTLSLRNDANLQLDSLFLLFLFLGSNFGLSVSCNNKRVREEYVEPRLLTRKE